MTGREDEEVTLSQWSRRLAQALQILDFEVDQKLLGELADKSARHISPSAGAVSALVVGYAAGLAVKSGQGSGNEAVRAAARTALQLCEDGAEAGQDQAGWAGTAQ